MKEEEKPVYSYYDAGNCKSGKSVKDGPAKGGHECTVGMVIPPEDDKLCVLQKTLSDVSKNKIKAITLLIFLANKKI